MAGATGVDIACDLKPANEWTPFRAMMTLPVDTGAALVHLQLVGAGTASLDELRIEPSDDPTTSDEAEAKPVSVQKVTLKRANEAKWNHVYVGGGTVTFITRNPNPNSPTSCGPRPMSRG